MSELPKSPSPWSQYRLRRKIGTIYLIASALLSQAIVLLIGLAIFSRFHVRDVMDPWLLKMLVLETIGNGCYLFAGVQIVRGDRKADGIAVAVIVGHAWVSGRIIGSMFENEYPNSLVGVGVWPELRKSRR